MAKTEAIEPVAEPVQDPDLEVVVATDPLAPDVMDNTLRDKMKGRLLACLCVEFYQVWDETIILSVLYECEAWSVSLVGEERLRIF